MHREGVDVEDQTMRVGVQIRESTNSGCSATVYGNDLSPGPSPERGGEMWSVVTLLPLPS
jgi:hypothetical protein